MWKRRAVLELVVVWYVGFSGWTYPTPNAVISGGMGMLLMLAGLLEAAGAERRPMGTRIAEVDAGTTCSAVVNMQDGALRLGEVGGLHSRGDRVSHSGWQQQQWS